MSELQMRKAHYSESPDGTSRRLTIYDGMNADNAKLVLAGGFDSLLLSYGDWEDLSLLRGANPLLSELLINNYGAVDLGSLQHLPNLRKLQLQAIERVPRGQLLDFSWFPKLESCEIHWRNFVAENIECAASLEAVALRGFKSPDFRRLGMLPKLRRLALIESPLSELTDIGLLHQLEELELSALPKLQSISPLVNVESLTRCYIDRCGKVADLDVLIRVRSLRAVGIRGRKQLFPFGRIHELTQLEEINIDCRLDSFSSGQLQRLGNLRNLTLIDVPKSQIPSDLESSVREVDQNATLKVVAAGRSASTIVINIPR